MATQNAGRRTIRRRRWWGSQLAGAVEIVVDRQKIKKGNCITYPKHNYVQPCGWLIIFPNFLIFFMFWGTSIAPNGQYV